MFHYFAVTFGQLVTHTAKFSGERMRALLSLTSIVPNIIPLIRQQADYST